ncbi:MAG: hypothetical protein ACK56I_24965, partial [bacterium]
LEYGYPKNSEFYADFETVEKNAKNLLTKKLQAKKCAKLEFVLFPLITFKRFWQITFTRYTYSNYFHGVEIIVKFSVIFGYSYVKKEIKKFWGHGVHI